MSVPVGFALFGIRPDLLESVSCFPYKFWGSSYTAVKVSTSNENKVYKLNKLKMNNITFSCPKRPEHFIMFFQRGVVIVLVQQEVALKMMNLLCFSKKKLDCILTSKCSCKRSR